MERPREEVPRVAAALTAPQPLAIIKRCVLPPCGACSSAVERRTVAPDDVGSNPTRHPNHRLDVPARHVRLLAYSSTKISFLAQISFTIFGHTVTLTSPSCAFRNRSIRVRDCPM